MSRRLAATLAHERFHQLYGGDEESAGDQLARALGARCKRRGVIGGSESHANIQRNLWGGTDFARWRCPGPIRRRVVELYTTISSLTGAGAAPDSRRARATRK